MSVEVQNPPAQDDSSAESVANSNERSMYDTGLPSPYEHADRDVVIFDGDCRFCLQQVRRLQAWDSGNRLAFVSLHDPFVAKQYPDLTKDQMMDQMYLVDQKGNRYGGAAAFRYLTRRLPKLWIVSPLLHLPGTLPIWQWGYKQVAKRRYKIAGKMGQNCDSGSCDIHFK